MITESMPYRYVSESERSVIDSWWDLFAHVEAMLRNPFAHTFEEFVSMQDKVSEIGYRMREYDYSGIEADELVCSIDFILENEDYGDAGTVNDV